MLLRKIKYAVFIVFITALVATLYVSTIGLPHVLSQKIEKRLQFSGMVITLQKVRLGIFEGVIATNIRCHRKGDIGVPVLEAEKIVLLFRPLAWFQGRTGLCGAVVKNGLISIQLRSPATNSAAFRDERFNIHVLNARIGWNEPATRLHVQECVARMPGIKITGRGELLLPRENAPAPAATTNADLTTPAGEHPHKVRLLKLLSAWGQFGMSTNGSGEVNVDITCSLDPDDINSAEVRLQADARRSCFRKTAIGAWRLILEMKGATGQGALDLVDTDIEGADVAKVHGQFQFDDQKFSLQSLDAIVGQNDWRGPLHLSGVYDWKTRQCQGALKTAFNPNALVPLLYSMRLPQAFMVEWFQFDEQPPVAKADFSCGFGTNFFFRLRGHAQGDNCPFDGVTNLLMKADLALSFSDTNASLTLDPLLVVREEGMVQGKAHINFLGQTVTFNGLSTADPEAVARMLSPAIDAIVSSFRFDGPAKVAAWGTADYMGGELNDMDIEISAQQAGWKQLLMDHCSLSLRVLADTVYINDAQAAFCHGRIEGNGTVYPVLNSTNMRYHLEADLDDVNFQILARNMTGKAADQYRGYLSGHLELEGFLDDPDGQTALGKGWVKIGGSRLFQIPIFGGLSEFLGRIVPGLSLIMRQTDAQAKFVIKDGKIHSDDIVIEGEVITLTGTGDYHWNGDLDFAVQVKLLKKNTLLGGIVHLAMMPVTKMLEFRLTGTVKEPRWRPAYLPKEMFFIFD